MRSIVSAASVSFSKIQWVRTKVFPGATHSVVRPLYASSIRVDSAASEPNSCGVLSGKSCVPGLGFWWSFNREDYFVDLCDRRRRRGVGCRQ
jgi:hypothetical protein